MKKLRAFFQKIGTWIVARKVRFFLIAGLLAATTILLLDYLFLNSSNKADVIVEAHGMLFDIILFGIILTIYEAITDKKDRIERYKEEIEDFLGWESNEAKFRIIGNIKRLNRLGVSDINLGKAYLPETILSKMVLQGTGLKGAYIQAADLQGANLFEANLQGARLSHANLQGANLSNANLQGANLLNANLQRAYLGRADLQRAYLKEADLQGANLLDANLQGAGLSQANLQEVNLWRVNLQGANLFEARLQGANLPEANLQGADLRGAEAYKSQRVSFSKVMTEGQLDSMVWIEDLDWKDKEDEHPTFNLSQFQQNLQLGKEMLYTSAQTTDKLSFDISSPVGAYLAMVKADGKSARLQINKK